MRHKVTLKEITKEEYSFVVASEATVEEKKRLRFVMIEGSWGWQVQYWKDRKLVKETSIIAILSEAVAIYNMT